VGVESLKNIIRHFLSHPGIDSDRLKKIVRMSRHIPEKCLHFQLEKAGLEDISSRRSLLESAISISLEKENFRNLNPEELFKYARRLEEKYAADISQLRFFADKINLEKGFANACSQAFLLIKNFDNQEEIIRLFEQSSFPGVLDTPLKEWFGELGETIGHASDEEHVLAGWFVHYAILTALPAFPRHAVFARICHQIYLQMTGLNGNNTVFLAPEMLPHQSMYKRISEQLRFKRWDDLPKSDMSSLFNFGLEVQEAAVQSANRLIRELYHRQVEFEDLSPRQRNMVNFFFDEGFRMEKPDTKGLNERQEKILEIVYERHSVSTKDLSLIFRCNRKTIQRDFYELLEMGLVRQMGSGAALRYTVQIRNNPNEKLQRLQNLQLGEATAQISLFSNVLF
jgi:hypothetical protein